MATLYSTTADMRAEQERANDAIGNAMIALQDMADELMIVPEMTSQDETNTAVLFADTLTANVRQLRDTLAARRAELRRAFFNRLAPGLGDDMARLPTGLAALLGQALPSIGGEG